MLKEPVFFLFYGLAKALHPTFHGWLAAHPDFRIIPRQYGCDHVCHFPRKKSEKSARQLKNDLRRQFIREVVIGTGFSSALASLPCNMASNKVYLCATFPSNPQSVFATFLETLITLFEKFPAIFSVFVYVFFSHL